LAVGERPRREDKPLQELPSSEGLLGGLCAAEVATAIPRDAVLVVALLSLCEEAVAATYGRYTLCPVGVRLREEGERGREDVRRHGRSELRECHCAGNLRGGGQRGGSGSSMRTPRTLSDACISFAFTDAIGEVAD